MEIKKVFNNNVVLVENEKQIEMIVMGCGLAFQKKAGDLVDQAKIEKTFVLEKPGISEKIAALLPETSDLYLGLASRIIAYAKQQLSNNFDDYLYVALTDHLSFAVKRHKQNLQLKNALLWEIKNYYKSEFQVGLKALEYITEATGINLAEDEAAAIAMHLVNSQLSGEGLQDIVEVTKIVNNILSIVRIHYKMALAENSISYERFLTHLRFFAARLIRKEGQKPQTETGFLYRQVKQQYPQAFACGVKIGKYVQNTYRSTLDQDELVYLTVHIQRVTHRNDSIS